MNFQKFCIQLQKIRTENKESKSIIITWLGESIIHWRSWTYLSSKVNLLPDCNCFPAIEHAKIVKIFACGELNLLNFEQLNPASPKLYSLNLKERPLLLEPGKLRLV